MTDRILEKLRNLKNMAERGTPHEADNARRALEKLLKKHGVTLDQLSDDKTNECWFTYTNNLELSLLIQIVGTVIGGKSVSSYGVKFNSHKERGFDLTPLQYARVNELYDACRKPFKQAIEEAKNNAVSAFFRSNNLYPESDDTDDKDFTPTPEDIKRWMIIEAMSRAIEPVKLPAKQLNSGNGKL